MERYDLLSSETDQTGDIVPGCIVCSLEPLREDSKTLGRKMEKRDIGVERISVADSDNLEIRKRWYRKFFFFLYNS